MLYIAPICINIRRNMTAHTAQETVKYHTHGSAVCHAVYRGKKMYLASSFESIESDATADHPPLTMETAKPNSQLPLLPTMPDAHKFIICCFWRFCSPRLLNIVSVSWCGCGYTHASSQWTHAVHQRNRFLENFKQPFGWRSTSASTRHPTQRTPSTLENDDRTTKLHHHMGLVRTHRPTFVVES